MAADTLTATERFLAESDQPRPDLTEQQMAGISQWVDPEEVAQATAEAMEPASSLDSVTIVGRSGSIVVPIRFMTMKNERRFKALVQGVLSAMRSEGQLSVGSITAVLESSFDTALDAMAIIADDAELADLTPEWIEDNCSIMQLLPVIAAQLAKYKQGNLLGEFFRGFGLVG